MVADLDPTGPVETALAGRAAHLLWRLQRVAAIDAAAGAATAGLPPDPATITGDGVMDPVAPLPADAPDVVRLARTRAPLRNTRRALAELGAAGGVIEPRTVRRVLDAVGVVAGWGVETARRVAELRARLGQPVELLGPSEWTVIQLRTALTAVADGLGLPAAALGDAVRDMVEALRDEAVALLREGEAEEADVAGRMAAARCRALAGRALSGAGVPDKVLRQEGHLGRQLDLTLRQLDRLKAARQLGWKPVPWGSG